MLQYVSSADLGGLKRPPIEVFQSITLQRAGGLSQSAIMQSARHVVSVLLLSRG